MIPLTTAKLLLFVALCLGPKEKDLPANHVILITSNAVNCVWTQEPHGWNLSAKDVPTHDWSSSGTDFSTQDLNSVVTENRAAVRAISHHDWSHDGVLILSNGDRVEKRGTQIFYTTNNGGSNEQIYTLLTLQNGVPL